MSLAGARRDLSRLSLNSRPSAARLGLSAGAMGTGQERPCGARVNRDCCFRRGVAVAGLVTLTAASPMHAVD